MQRVQGLGGFFFRAKDPEGLAKWYHDHLGINPAPKNMDMSPWECDRALGAGGVRLLHRERVLLSFLHAFGGEMRDGDFQVLLFDYSRRCRERGVDGAYDFIVQERGPRSFTAVADRDRLARCGFFVSGTWRLSAEGHRLAGNLKSRDLAVFAAGWQRRRDVSGTDGEHAPVANHGRSGVADGNGSPGGFLATIGYEGRSYEAYLNLLLGAGISRLCDVRRNPFSRRCGFSKRLLAQGCEEPGIRYEPFPELGIASQHRTGTATGQRTTASLPGTKPRHCRAAGTPW